LETLTIEPPELPEKQSPLKNSGQRDSGYNEVRKRFDYIKVNFQGITPFLEVDVFKGHKITF
jgi:hypothetical protein